MPEHRLYSLDVQSTHDFVRDIADCRAEIGTTFSAKYPATRVGIRVRNEDLEGPSDVERWEMGDECWQSVSYAQPEMKQGQTRFLCVVLNFNFVEYPSRPTGARASPLRLATTTGKK